MYFKAAQKYKYARWNLPPIVHIVIIRPYYRFFSSLIFTKAPNELVNEEDEDMWALFDLFKINLIPQGKLSIYAINYSATYTLHSFANIVITIIPVHIPILSLNMVWLALIEKALRLQLVMGINATHASC